MAIVTAVEPYSVSCKSVSIPGTSLSGSSQALWCLCFNIHTHKSVLAMNLARSVLPGQGSKKFVSIPENAVSLALVRRYSAHATASHAQDCPDQKLERPVLPWSSSISLFLLQEMSFL